MAKTDHSKLVCPAFKGNGYRRIFSNTAILKIVIDCKACDNQGEVNNDKETIFGLRYLKHLH